MRFVYLFFFCLLTLFPAIAHSHGTGSPFTVEVNNESVEPYFLEEAGVYSADLVVPNDIAPKSYLVNEEILFEVDLSEVKEAENAFVKWDFGNGKTAEGVIVRNIYGKAGSYIVGINIETDGLDSSEKILVHILPKEDYRLPKAAIRVNGQSGSVDNFNILEFDLNNELELDGSESSAPDSRIAKFVWDFGDDKIAIGEKVSHQYELPQAFATVLLRVTDANGLISDTIVNVRNNGSNVQRIHSSSSLLSIILPTVLVVAIIVGGLSLFKRKKR
jgi:hypothetical protein